MERNVLSGLSALALGAVVLGMGAATSHAALVPIDNPSFEDSPRVARMLTAVDGWTEDTPIVYISNDPGDVLPGADGKVVVWAQGDVFSKFSQTLTTSVNTSSTYDLKFLVGYNGSHGANDYQVRLYAGNSVVATYSESASTVPFGSMVERTLNYTPAPTDSGLLKIEVALTSTGTGTDTIFDNFRLNETAVPEPASVALLGLGASALVMRRRRHA